MSPPCSVRVRERGLLHCRKWFEAGFSDCDPVVYATDEVDSVILVTQLTASCGWELRRAPRLGVYCKSVPGPFSVDAAFDFSVDLLHSSSSVLSTSSDSACRACASHSHLLLHHATDTHSLPLSHTHPSSPPIPFEFEDAVVHRCARTRPSSARRARRR